MTFTTILFYILSAVLVYAAFRVITASSSVVAVLHLILAFFNASMLWMLLGAEFLSLLLIVVYVGAVMVLFLFVVMMLDIRMEALREGIRGFLPMGLLVGGIMVVEMAFVLVSTWGDAGPAFAQPDDYNSALALGQLLYTEYVYGVEIAAAILLVGMIAAIALTLRRRHDTKHNRPSEQLKARASERFRLVKIEPQSERVHAADQKNAAQDQGEQA